MVSISRVNTAAIRPTVGKEAAAPVTRQPEKEKSSSPQKPARDKYVPEEEREPIGRYWMGKDEDGQPKVFFDSPEQPTPQKPEAPLKPDGSAQGPESAPGRKKERCVADTSKVDRELDKLKKKKEELERRLNTETDPVKLQELKRKLAQVGSELGQKDNDAYRRQHTTFTELA